MGGAIGGDGAMGAMALGGDWGRRPAARSTRTRAHTQRPLAGGSPDQSHRPAGLSLLFLTALHLQAVVQLGGAGVEALSASKGKKENKKNDKEARMHSIPLRD